MKYFPFRTVPHFGNFPHFRGNVSRFSILSAIALALIPLFYGCSDPSSHDLPKNSGVKETGSQGRITDFDRENAGIPPLPDAEDSSPSEESPTPSEPTDPAESSAPSTPTTPSDSIDSDADLSGLSMEDFDFSTAVIGETGSESEVDSTETQKAVRSLDVPEEIREEFTRRSDLSYTPKLSGWKEGGETVDPNGERFLFRYRFESGSESR